MPIYEYECRDCGHVFDALQKMSDQPLTDCPSCSKPALRKLLSAPNFRLKGGGWYETDFKNKNKRNLVDGDKSTGKSSGDADGGVKSSADKSATGKSVDTGKSASDKSGSAGGSAAKAE